MQDLFESAGLKVLFVPLKLDKITENIDCPTENFKVTW